MQLELATIDDIIDELRRRKVPFVLARISEGKSSHVKYACQADSCESIRQMLRDVDWHVQTQCEPQVGDGFEADINHRLTRKNTDQRS